MISLDVCDEADKGGAVMLRLGSAIVLTLVWLVGLAALIGPGMGTIEDGLGSGKRIALAHYAEQHSEAQ
jgi:hypothetical protein